MRFVHLPNLASLGAMIVIAGSPRNAAQQVLLIVGIVLTIINTLILALCRDAWRYLEGEE